MVAMERLLSTNAINEPTEEEIALEQAALMSVHKEMSEADEANLLDEEDMHVFDREPLVDHLPLVSCNLCKKPVKASQYALHAERCRSLNSSEDTGMEFGGGPVSKKAPRKQRKKISTVQENLSRSSEGDKLRTPDGDDGVLSESVCVSGGAGDDQAPAVTSSSNPRGSKRVMNISESNAPKVGRPRKNPASVTPKASNGGATPGVEDVAGTSSSTALLDSTLAQANLTKMNMIHSSLSSEELDIMCGVMSINGSCCRQPLTCKTHPETSKRAVFGRRKPFDVLVQESKEGSVTRLRSELKRKRLHETEANLNLRKSVSMSCPKPLASKVYCLGHKDRMRFVIGHLYRRNCSSMTTTGNEIVATQVGMQPSTFPASTYEYPHLDVKPNVSVFDNMAGKMQEIRHPSAQQLISITKPLQTWPVADQPQGPVEVHSSVGGLQSPHRDSRYLPTSRPSENGLSSMGKAWQNRMSTVLPGTPGNSGPQAFAGVSAS